MSWIHRYHLQWLFQENSVVMLTSRRSLFSQYFKYGFLVCLFKTLRLYKPTSNVSINPYPFNGPQMHLFRCKMMKPLQGDHFQCNSIPFVQQIDLTPPMNMHTFNQSNWIFKMIRKLQFWPLTIFSISFCVICLWVYTINASNFNLNWNFNSRLIFTSQTPISLNMLHIQYLR